MNELERRRAPRSLVEMDCTTRPLAVDEELDFDLPPLPFPLVGGRARVLRDQGGDVDGLRFEGLGRQPSEGTTIHSTR